MTAFFDSTREPNHDGMPLGGRFEDDGGGPVPRQSMDQLAEGLDPWARQIFRTMSTRANLARSADALHTLSELAPPAPRRAREG